MKALKASLMTASALLLLAGCGTTHSGWKSGGPDYVPAKQAPASVASLPPSRRQGLAPTVRKDGRKRLTGAAAVAAANKAAVRSVGDGEMCGFAWCIPDFDPRQTHIVQVQDGEFLEIKLPPDERALDEPGMGTIANMVPEPMKIQSIDSDTMAFKPEGLDRSGDIVIFTKSGKSFRFRFVPSKAGLRRIEILGTRAAPSINGSSGDSFRPAELKPQLPYTPLALIPLDTPSLPPGAPVNAWTDQRRMVVELPGKFPRPTFLATKRGDAVVAYHIIEYVNRYGEKIVAYVTDRPITEAVVAGDGWRVLITADKSKLEKRSRWFKAAGMPGLDREGEDADADLAYEDGLPDRRERIMPASDDVLDGSDGGVLADEIEAVMEQNRRRKRPIAGSPPEGIPIEDIKGMRWG